MGNDETLALQRAVENSRERGSVDYDVSYRSLRRRIEDLYREFGYNPEPGVVVDNSSRTERIDLENATIGFSGTNHHIYVPGRLSVVPWVNEANKYNMSREEIKRQWEKIMLQRHGAVLDGDYEIDGVHHSFGELEAMEPPAFILSEAAELTFDSETHAKAANSDGSIRRYKNGTLSVNGAVLTLDGVRTEEGSVDEEMEKLYNLYYWTVISGALGVSGCEAGGAGYIIGFPALVIAMITGGMALSKYIDTRAERARCSRGDINLGFYGHLAKRPIRNYG